MMTGTTVHISHQDYERVCCILTSEIKHVEAASTRIYHQFI